MGAVGAALLCVGLASASPALAWGNAGHAQIAEVAWSRLDADSRRALVQALEQHPRFAEDFAARMPHSMKAGAARDRWIFSQASIWPDTARRFKDAEDPDLRKLHRGRWHYVNEPVTLPGSVYRGRANRGQRLSRCRAREELNVMQALSLSLCKLRDPRTPDADRGLYLSWLLHLVGDLHQPLHTVSLYSKTAFRRGDRGGNAIRPEGVSSLHAAWDRLPGGTGRQDRVGTRAAAAKVRRLLADPKLMAAGRRASEELAFATWLGESVGLAREFVYTEAMFDSVRDSERRHPRRRTVDLPALDAAYLERAGAVAERRVVEAGFRLAAILDGLNW